VLSAAVILIFSDTGNRHLDRGPLYILSPLAIWVFPIEEKMPGQAVGIAVIRRPYNSGS